MTNPTGPREYHASEEFAKFAHPFEPSPRLITGTIYIRRLCQM